MKPASILNREKNAAAREARRKAAANRLNVTSRRVCEAVAREYPEATVTPCVTTSGAPLIRVALPDSDVFHITVTKARK